MKKIVILASACLLLTANIAAQAQTVNERTDKDKAAKNKESRNVIVNNNDDDEKEEEGQLRTYKTKLGTGKDKQVLIQMFGSEVRVVGHSSDEVVIETKNYSAPPARAQGLKPLYNQAEDNTNLGLSVTKDNNILKITKASRQGGHYTIRVPRNASVIYRETNWNGGNFTLSDVDGEVEIKLNNASATLTNVSGPVVANTTNGSINIKFSRLDQGKPSALSTINGAIDITLPAATKADFKLKSIQGEIYTDFDLNLPRDTKSDLPKVAGGNTIAGKVNGGGVEMNIRTINSDIFIRKNK
jgi:hypothetical protein